MKYVKTLEEFIGEDSDDRLKKEKKKVLKDEKIKAAFKYIDSDHDEEILKYTQKIVRFLDKQVISLVKSDFKSGVYNETSYENAEGDLGEYLDELEDHLDEKFDDISLLRIWELEDEGPSTSNVLKFLVKNDYLSPNSYIKLGKSTIKEVDKIKKKEDSQ